VKVCLGAWHLSGDYADQVSCDAYRDVVRKDPRFIEFFSQSTPVSELGRMNIGSRPAKRKAAGSIDSLRAIPWIFAWTQTRFHLPVWLGVGEAFQVLLLHPMLLCVLQVQQHCDKTCSLQLQASLCCLDACLDDHVSQVSANVGIDSSLPAEHTSACKHAVDIIFWSY